MPDLTSLSIALGAMIISIVSFYYGRKPLINIAIKDIGTNYTVPTDYEFTIKNVSKNPAEDVLVSVKLIYNETPHNIGNYKLEPQ